MNNDSMSPLQDVVRNQYLRWVWLPILLVAGVGVGVGWHHTNQTKVFVSALNSSSLDQETKRLLMELVKLPEAWDTGLIQSLPGPISLKHLVWQGTTKSAQHGPKRVFIFDAFIRPVADAPIPPVCVICDEQQQLITWASVAPYSAGFLQASLSDDGVLTLTTVANWFRGKGTYRYAINNQSIVPLGEGEFTQFDEHDQVERLPKLVAPQLNL